MPRIRLALLTALLFLGVAACDNIGRAFDRDLNGDDPTAPAGESAIEVVPVGGVARDGRPLVRAAYPEGGGWPGTVPIVVEFSESMNQASVVPTTPTGIDGRVILRVRGTTQALPCQYDFVANGRVLVLRPLTELSNAQNPIYEVVLLPDVRDSDGVRFKVDEDELLLTDFQVNQEASFTDGRILAVFPRDNERDAVRQTDYWVFFDRPANRTTITATSLRLRRTGGGDVAGQRPFPFGPTDTPDTRVVRFRPENPLLGATSYELVVDATITFGADGQLDFRNRTPFARFETVAPAAPAAVELADPVPGFPNKINRDRIANARLSVTTAADTVPGDRIVARIYGGAAQTTNSADLTFVERTVEAPAAGTQTLTLDFTGELGTLARPEFDDGELTFAVRTQRGSQHSGFAHDDNADAAAFDITPPTLRRVGPPATGTGFDVVTDQPSIALFGGASEGIGAAEIVAAGGSPAALFASEAAGDFLLEPVPLGRLTAPAMYSLNLTDRAGNLGASAQGNVVQRGVVTGSGTTDLVVEAYDHTTLQVLAGVSVLVDAAVPNVPGTGQLVAQTGGNGRATFAGAAATPHTVTVTAPGYHLLTVVATNAPFLSLPLTPIEGGVATLQGNAVIPPAPGATVLVGCTEFADPDVLWVRSANASPTSIPETPIRPNRPAMVSAFGGAFEPTTVSAFQVQGFQALGADLMTPTPPTAPPAAGGSLDQSLLLQINDVGQTSVSLPVDLAASVGFDTTTLVGGRPIVRVVSALRGFTGQLLTGVGRAEATGGAVFDLDVNYSKPAMDAFTGFGVAERSWVLAEAEDGAGRRLRWRQRFDVATGAPEPFVPPLSIPVVDAPGGPFSRAPLVSVADVLDATVLAGSVTTLEVVATDTAGRRWTLLVPDTDAVGGTDSVQFPDLVQNNVSRLANGTWNVRAEARLWLAPGSSHDDFVLSSRRTFEVLTARGISVPHTVQ